jgi:CheY-like chemotaxis protein
MPVIDGFAVLRDLRADPRTERTPVIVATSLTIDAELRTRLPAGVRLISKNHISRDTVALFLREATQGTA